MFINIRVVKRYAGVNSEIALVEWTVVLVVDGTTFKEFKESVTSRVTLGRE